MRGLKTAGMAALLALVGNCGGKGAGPSPATFTETFTGTVAQGGTSFGDGNRNYFTVHKPGVITATITRLSPYDVGDIHDTSIDYTVTMVYT